MVVIVCTCVRFRDRWEFCTLRSKEVDGIDGHSDIGVVEMLVSFSRGYAVFPYHFLQKQGYYSYIDTQFLTSAS